MFGPSPYSITAFPRYGVGANMPQSFYNLSQPFSTFGFWSLDYDSRRARLITPSTASGLVVGLRPVTRPAGATPAFGSDAHRGSLHIYYEPVTPAFCSQVIQAFMDGECHLWLLCTRYAVTSGAGPVHVAGWQGLALKDTCEAAPPSALKASIAFGEQLKLSGPDETRSVLSKMVFYHPSGNGRTDIFVSDAPASRLYRARDVYGTQPIVERMPDVITVAVPFINGLEVFGDILLMSGGLPGATSGLFAYNLAQPDAPVAALAGASIDASSPVVDGEQLRFDAAQRYLYFAKRISHNGSRAMNEYIVLESSDGWTSSARVAHRQPILACDTAPMDYSATIGFVPSAGDGVRVWTACNQDNGPGPYQIVDAAPLYRPFIGASTATPPPPSLWPPPSPPMSSTSVTSGAALMIMSAVVTFGIMGAMIWMHNRKQAQWDPTVLNEEPDTRVRQVMGLRTSARSERM